jgi:hypothetical protein
MYRISLLLVLLGLTVGCTLERDLKNEAATALRTCMEQGGIAPVRDVVFHIGKDRQLVDWNANYPGQGGADADNLHNACVRKIVTDLELVANLP